MSVHVDLCQRADIYLVFPVSIDVLGEDIIQAVDAFYDQYLPRIQFRDPVAESLSSLEKVELRNIYFFSGKEILHLGVEEIEIYRPEALKVRFSVSSKRSIASLDKIVIRSQIQRLFRQLRDRAAESLGGSCFAAR